MWNHADRRFERCEACRFDSSAYTNDDVTGTLGHIERMVRFSARDVDTEVLNVRPEPTTWSPNEYVRHMKGVIKAMRFLVAVALETPGRTLSGEPPADASPDDAVDALDFEHEVARLGAEAQALLEVWVGADAGRRRASIELNGETADVGGIVRHCAHELTHHLSDFGRAVGELVPPTGSGVVSSVHVGRGVPKPEVTTGPIAVGYRGLDSDVQRIRKHHGRVWQAVCLWSGDVIDVLRAEGHPVGPGTCGENLVVRGLDWAALRGGMRLRFDSGLELELTDHATPCKTIAESFLDRDFRRISEQRQPGISRLYAKTVTDGALVAGDRITVS